MPRPIIIESSDATDIMIVSLSKPSSALRMAYYILFGLLIGIGVWAYWCVIDIRVVTYGVIRPLTGAQTLHAPLTGTIQSIGVKEFQWVNAGDTIALFDTKIVEEKIALCDAKLEHHKQEEHDLSMLQSGQMKEPFALAEFRHEYQVALKEQKLYERELQLLSAKLNRADQLLSKDFVSREEQERAKLDVDQKEITFRRWQQQRFREISERIERVRRAKQEIETEKKNLLLEQSKSHLVAPISGYVTTLPIRNRQSFMAIGEVVCVITHKEELIAEMYIPAKDIGFIGKGLPISYQIDAFPFQEWGFAHGNVQNISQDYVVQSQDTRNGVANFKVIGSFRLDSLVSPRQLRAVKLSAGLTYRASIVVAQKRMIELVWDKSVRYFSLS